MQEGKQIQNHLDPKLLRSLLDYNEATGRLTWKSRSRPRWDKRYADKPAFTAFLNTGYLQGVIFGRHYVAHRVAWAIYYGKWPTKQLDHINRIRSDNRIANLREVTDQENKMNLPRPKNNTSGHIGVSWVPHLAKWNAYVNADHRRTNLGYFRSLDDAVAARQAAQERLGFHPNHGETPDIRPALR